LSKITGDSSSVGGSNQLSTNHITLALASSYNYIKR
jgi:hypothetical protein